MKPSSIYENMFGMVRGKYIGESPLYVDTSLPPGMTNMPVPTVASWIWNIPFGVVTTPNFIWASISLMFYAAAPYNLGPDSPAAQAPISSAFFLERFPIWFSITFGYVSFWHITLYSFAVAQRPFVSKRVYNVDKVIHNIFWTTSGIAIWTIFENVIAYLWATARLPYISNETTFSTVWGFAYFMFALIGIPAWRSIHFYFAHRFLHYTPLYTQVHSLHHRNTDIEPFSGLCMHPVEHMYYFACVLPNLVLYCSPFALVWNGVHLLLSPAASHSGYEDHSQSDLFHYLHHYYFECNYAGSDAAFMDKAFGTFKASFQNLVDKDGPKQREDAKSTLRVIPTKEFVLYLLGSASCVLSWAFIAIQQRPVSANQALAYSSLVGFGPVILASGVSHFFHSRYTNHPVKMSLSANMLHLFFGVLMCSVPITYGCWLSIMPKVSQ
jgi:sterol desaturase/sphingolipid hydroxylase (fatty acid hydroxylase superfamily)